VLKQRTVILITHRPASLAMADRVLRLDPGCSAVIDAPLPAAIAPSRADT
jgi:ABC-type multidrug transport system fused ATPase/permease subunit